MRLILSYLTLAAGLMGYFSLPLSAQKDSSLHKSSLDVHVALVSRYVWRGLLLNPSPGIQPDVKFKRGNFSVGAWGNYSITNYYIEVDLFMAYSFKGFTFKLTDYFSTYDIADTYDYLNWKKNSTNHIIEGNLGWTAPWKIPVCINGYIMFYGYDRDQFDKQLYSSYIEAECPFKIGENTLRLFTGYTPYKGYYNLQKASFVNVGLNAIHEIKVTPGFSIPLNLSLAVNPSNKRVFFIALIRI